MATNLSIAVGTALVGGFGPAAIAGYGTARGLNTCWCRWSSAWVRRWWRWSAPASAPARERAMRAAWIGAAMAFVDRCHRAWRGLSDAWLRCSARPAMLEAGTIPAQVGPLYGFFGLGLVLYFASQGAGRLLWPVLAISRAWRWRPGRLAGAALGRRALACVLRAERWRCLLYGLVNAGAIVEVAPGSVR